MRGRCVALLLCFACVGMALGCATPRHAAREGTLDALTRLSDARTQRVSSSDPNPQGNSDRRAIAPGETLTLAEIDGPAVITHIWCTINAADPAYSRSLVLRVYWDDEDEPAIEAPIGDFFAVGHGVDVPVNSIPVEVSSEGRARNCFWRMPFRKRARLTVTNDSPTYRVNSFYYYIDYESVPSLPRNTPYFHAQYRQEYPCQPGDYLICDAVGRGHYVGTVLSVWHTQPSWFGEGDDRFYIDGASTPTLHGTGTEDYFSDAWGFREFNQPNHGVSLWEGAYIGARGTAYRWHIADPIRFRESLLFTIEHTGPVFAPDGKRVAGYGERNDLFSSVAFWYQTGKAKRFANIPPVEERNPPSRRIAAHTLAVPATSRTIEGASITAQTSGSGRRAQRRLWFRPADIVEAPWLEVDFEAPEDGRYLVNGTVTHSWDYGDFRVLLDGVVVEKQAKLYSEEPESVDHRWGAHDLTAGAHTLRFERVGANPLSQQNDGSPGRYLGLETIELIRLDW